MKSQNPAYYLCQIKTCIESGGEADAIGCLHSVQKNIYTIPTMTLQNIRHMIKRKQAQRKRIAIYREAERIHGGNPDDSVFRPSWCSEGAIKAWEKLDTLCQNELAKRIEKGEQP